MEDELAPERWVSTPPCSPLCAPTHLSFGDRASCGMFSPAPEGLVPTTDAAHSVQQSVLLLQKSVRLRTAPAVAVASSANLRVLATDCAALLRPFQL